MVISQPAVIELADTYARVERPLVKLVAWLRRSRPPSSPVLTTGVIASSPESFAADDSWMDGWDRLPADRVPSAPVRRPN